MVTIFRSRQTIELKKLEQDEQLELAKLEAVYDELRTDVDPERKVILKAKIPLIDARLNEIQQQKQAQGSNHLVNQTDVRQDLWNDLRSVMQNRLEGSLEDEIRAELKLTFQPQAVVNRQFRLRSGEQTLRADEDILSVFEKAGGQLLILGAPGAGKTITLFRLGLQLLTRAQQPTSLLPVIFELSNWAHKRKRLQDWLADELGQRTFSQHARWRSWVDPAQPRILPLLDGLDEVPPQYLDECIEAINAYCQSNLMRVVVCSRSLEYGQAERKLQLRGAVELQPLNDDQIHAYLSSLGATASSLQTTLAADSALLELARVPLLLNMLVLAYQGDATPNTENLFSEYIARRFELATVSKNRYSSQQTRHYLRWLAQQMQQRDLQEFAIEALQKDWLPFEWQKHYPRLLKLVYGLSVGLGGGLLSGLVFGLVFGLLSGLAFGLVFGLLSGLAFGLVVGLLSGLAFGLIVGLVGGLVFGLMFGVGGRLRENIVPVDALSWSGEIAWRKGKSILAFGALFGIVEGLVVGLTVGLVIGTMYGLAFGLVFGLAGGGVWIIDEIIKEGFRPHPLLRTQNNQGIWRSVRGGIGILGLYMLVFGAVFNLAGGLASMLGAVLVFGPTNKLEGALSVGLLLGLAGGLVFGLITGLYSDKGLSVAIHHTTLRYTLWRSKVAPLNFADFLHHAVQLRMMVRVGGSYKFLHRMLQEHFAKQQELPPAA